jgi:alkylation response protein AidB-like acyl-CoA dehydrogenase
MDFTFTEEQRMMASAFRALAEDLCSPAALRAAFEGRGDDAASRWRRLAELGLPGVLGPEPAGGLGLALADFILIAESAGRAALPETLVEHAGIAVPLLAEFAADARAAPVLRDAIAGRARLAVSHPANPFMLGADAATHLLVMSDREVHLLRREEASLEPHRSVDALRPLSRLMTPLGAATCLARGPAAATASARAFERGALLAAAECAGLCDRMLAIAVAYAAERSQFGRKIGSYQAIKHQLANVQVKLEFARPVLYAAATRAGALDRRSQVGVSHAKLAAADAADLAARTAIQVHGAMGYSWEVDLHFFMKRSWGLTGAWGDRSFHMRRLQEHLFKHHLAIGPDQLFVRDAAPATTEGLE